MAAARTTRKLKPPRLQQAQPPTMIERRYEAWLLARVASLHRRVMAAIRGSLRSVGPAINKRAGRTDSLLVTPDRQYLQTMIVRDLVAGDVLPRIDAADVDSHLQGLMELVGRYRVDAVRSPATDRHTAELAAAVASFHEGGPVYRMDSPATDANSLVRATEKAYLSYSKEKRGVVEEFLRKTGQMTDLHAQTQLFTQVNRVIRVSVFRPGPDAITPKMYAGWLKTNTDLISSIESKYLTEVRAAVEQTIQSGQSTKAMVARMEERYGVTQSRARLIARDQVSKLNSNINQGRQEQLGIDRYTWSDSGDERVRDIHAQLDGHTFSWQKAPVTNDDGDHNHPGEDYQCRCMANAVFSGESIEKLTAEANVRRERDAKLSGRPVLDPVPVPRYTHSPTIVRKAA